MNFLILAFSVLIQQQVPAANPLPNPKTAPAPRELIEAARTGQVSKIREFSQHPGFPEKDDTGRTALIAAGERGQKAAFAELIAIMNERVRRQVEVIRTEGQPAVYLGMMAVQSRLSFFGAADKDGITPLMYAARYGWNDLVDPLLEGGVDITPKDANGRSAIEHARDAGHVEIVERLQKPRD
jgi:hypothetical protein